MGENWLLLLHQIPPTPAYSRAKILRRLSQVGALPLKNSAYLLPYNDDTLEDCRWISEEIAGVGGKAWLFRAETLAGMTPAELVNAFRELRAEDYRSLIEDARGELGAIAAGKPEAIPARARLVRRFEELRQIDFFEASGRAVLVEIMNEIESKLATILPGAGAASLPPNRIWITRKGVKVDRIGSAWLIRRFIDPQAEIRFVAPDRYQWRDNEVRFDMFEGEYTHRGELCTFEVLTGEHRPDDPALQAVAEIVHDIDLKDSRYQRPATVGFAKILEGLCLRTADDETRIERGSVLFESLYASFGG
jgi:hypothetical protein